MSRHAIALPDEERGWKLWVNRKVSAESRELVDAVGNRVDSAIGVPATLDTTFAVKLPTTDATLFESMVFAQIEKRGLGVGEVVFEHEVVHQEGNETLLSVDVLSSEFPETLCLPRASGYAPSARLIDLPEDRLMLWKEHRRLILAANRHGHLTHLQALSAPPELDATAAQEVNLTVLSLQGEGLVPENPELMVAGAGFRSDKGWDDFERALVIPADLSPESPLPRQSLDLNDSFLPGPVKDARRRRAAAKKGTSIVLAAAAAYVVAGVFLWLSAKNTKSTISRLEAEVAESRPVVDEILATEQRWRELEPAFNLTYYPLVQLNEITRVLPASGVLVRQFETRGTTIFVRGKARDIQMASRIKEELETVPFFSVYNWNMENPKVDQDNTANFNIQGVPKNAGTDG